MAGAHDKMVAINAGSSGTLDGAPSLITDGIGCTGYRYATCIAKVTANATDVATMEVWLGYITSGTVTQPITVEWVKDKRIPGGNFTATEGTDGDTAEVRLEIAGADRLYFRWQGQTDGDTRVKSWVKLSNPTNAIG